FVHPCPSPACGSALALQDCCSTDLPQLLRNSLARLVVRRGFKISVNHPVNGGVRATQLVHTVPRTSQPAEHNARPVLSRLPHSPDAIVRPATSAVVRPSKAGDWTARVPLPVHPWRLRPNARFEDDF